MQTHYRKENEMKNYSNLITLIIVFTLWLGLILGCGNRKEFTGQAPAVVKKATELRTQTDTGVSSSCSIDFTYTVNGRTYQASSENGSCYERGIGTQGKACYKPSDPQLAYFALPRETCGK